MKIRYMQYCGDHTSRAIRRICDAKMGKSIIVDYAMRRMALQERYPIGRPLWKPIDWENAKTWLYKEG